MDTARLEKWLQDEAHATRVTATETDGRWIARCRFPNGDRIEGFGETRAQAVTLLYARAGGPRDPKYGYRLLGRAPLVCFRCGGLLFERYDVNADDASEFELRRTGEGFEWRQPIASTATETLWSQASGQLLCVGCRVGKTEPTGLTVFDLEEGGDLVDP
jgi:hypothetical protein